MPGAGSAVGQDIAVVAACILKSIGQDGKAVEYLAGQAGRPVPSVIVVVPVPVTTDVVRGPSGPTSATGQPPTLGCSDAAEWLLSGPGVRNVALGSPSDTLLELPIKESRSCLFRRAFVNWTYIELAKLPADGSRPARCPSENLPELRRSRAC